MSACSEDRAAARVSVVVVVMMWRVMVWGWGVVVVVVMVPVAVVSMVMIVDEVLSFVVHNVGLVSQMRSSPIVAVSCLLD